MLRFLLVDESEFAVDPDDAARALGPDAVPVLGAAHDALAGLGSWTAGEIRDALQAALVDGLGLRPRDAFGGAVRVAITGRRVGPPLFESIEMLGRGPTLDRLAQAAARPVNPLAAASALRLHCSGAPGLSRRVRAWLARSHGVWGNWQPDGFWPR